MVYNICMANESIEEKNYIHTIEMRNETEFSDVYEKYKEAIYNHIMHELESFTFDIDLLVIFKNFGDKENLVNKEMWNGATTLKENKYTVMLNIYSLRKIDYDGGLDIAISVRHELCHVYDLYNIEHNKFYKLNPLKVNHENLDDFIMSIGCLFWTEFFAYYMTYKQFKKEYRYPTFLQLERGYKKLQKRCEEIDFMFDSNDEEVNSVITDYKDDVDYFVYAVAKHLAGICGGKSYKYDYNEKTKNRASFETVEKIRYNVHKKIVPLLTNTYGRGMASKMYKLGKYLLKNIYNRFNLYPIKQQKYIRFAYYY